MPYKKFTKSIQKLSQAALGATNDDLDRFAESDIFWAENRSGNFVNRQIKKGDIFQFEFGKNYIPEMSYEHRGLVIGKSGKLLYVLPICTYRSSNPDHKNAYHPIDNPDPSSKYYILKQTEFQFLTHDSVLKLDDLRTVSAKRIKYQQHGSINNTSDIYKNIERMCLRKCFPQFSYELDALNQENAKLQKENDELKSKLTTHTLDN